ncbi:MAG: hypothetical protein M1831_000578 [Alyxoria varia]|nr:MAG: hypothetical protein M1831_000578 [Alyxoria varia]
MASESRLYTFSQETKDHLRKFRLGTSRAKDPQAVIYHIDKPTLSISPDPSHDHTTPFTSLTDLSDALPDNTPRFILLSYPFTTSSNRPSTPYLLISYIPATSTSEMRMLYAGARELLKNEAGAGRVVECADEEEVEGVGEWIKGMDGGG